MKKLIVSILFLLFPMVLFAADDSSSALNFNPSVGDISVIFLSNIFGVVDGVLHGTGSQIMGAMFAVFNSAVLALGGMIIMYTLMVSTVNTAHEGQMLGQKWSSIWVPVRSTLGLTLLIPKASGYCLMQIIFMWVVVQGVGAADKVWEAALAYLNRGGVIVQAQVDPITMIMGSGQAVRAGAANILYGQACMLGLETLLKNTRNNYLNDKVETCKTAKAGTPIKDLCDNPVPDFLASVNTIDFQQRIEDAKEAETKSFNDPSTSQREKHDIAVRQSEQSSKSQGQPIPYKEDMPDFKSDPAYNKPPYNFLSGICGQISWNPINAGISAAMLKKSQDTVGGDNYKTVSKTRATAVQQMFSDLAAVAQDMVNNNPQLNVKSTNEAQPNIASWAKEAYGIPMTDAGALCQQTTLGQVPGPCTSWGTVGANSALFNGTEFQGAIADYNAIMMPTLTLFTDTTTPGGQNDPRSFLTEAKRTGWMLAGSYFFKLSTLSATNARSYAIGGGKTATEVSDTNSGLGGSTETAFSVDKVKNCEGSYSTLCKWLENKDIQLEFVLQMIRGTKADNMQPFDIPTNNTSGGKPQINAVSNPPQASTAYGFVQNSLMMTLPGQAGTVAPTFSLDLAPNFTVKGYTLPTANLDCQGFMCIPSVVGEVIYNYVIRYLFQVLITAMMTMLNTILMAFLALPLLGMGEIFKSAVEIIRNPNANPIVALANMGINFINFASDMWMFLLVIGISPFFLGPFGLFMLGIMLMALPLLIAWLGVMLAIGYLTAYYIPFVPYMIFTFASIAWLMAVVEAMVAAPIVALSITHPEGEGPFGGKAEQSLMILMNVFLRPSLMIIGYISGIILSYVCVWVINAGFMNVLPFMQGEASWSKPSVGTAKAWAEPSQGAGGERWNKEKLGDDKGVTAGYAYSSKQYSPDKPSDDSVIKANYTGWAGIYGFFFAIIVYTSMYLTVVQKSFGLIGILPDKVLRWIGSQPESIGQEAAQWAEESKKQVEGAGKSTEKAAGQLGKEAAGKGQEVVKGMKGGETQGSASETK